MILEGRSPPRIETTAALAPNAARPSRDDEVHKDGAGRLVGRARVTRWRRSIRAADASAARRASCSAAWPWAFEIARATRRASSVVTSTSADVYMVAGPDEEHRPDRLAPGEQRLDDHAPRSHRRDDRGQLRDLAGRPAQRDRIRQVLHEDRLVGADGPGGGPARADGRREVTGSRRGIGRHRPRQRPRPRERSEPSGSTRSIRHQSASCGMARPAAAYGLVQVGRLVEAEAGVGDEAGEVGSPLPVRALVLDVGRGADPALDRAALTDRAGRPGRRASDRRGRWQRRRTVRVQSLLRGRSGYGPRRRELRPVVGVDLLSGREQAARRDQAGVLNQRPFGGSTRGVPSGEAGDDGQRLDHLSVTPLAGEGGLSGLGLAGHVVERRDDESVGVGPAGHDPGPDQRPARAPGGSRKPTTSSFLVLARERAPPGEARGVKRGAGTPSTISKRSDSVACADAPSISSGLDQPQRSAAAAAGWHRPAAAGRPGTVIPASIASRIQPSRSSNVIDWADRVLWLDDSLAHVPSRNDEERTAAEAGTLVTHRPDYAVTGRRGAGVAASHTARVRWGHTGTRSSPRNRFSPRRRVRSRGRGRPSRLSLPGWDVPPSGRGRGVVLARLGVVAIRRQGQVLGDRRLARAWRPSSSTSAVAATGTARDSTMNPPAAAPASTLNRARERRDADRVSHHDRHQHVALDDLENDVDAEHDERELAATRTALGRRRAPAR